MFLEQVFFFKIIYLAAPFLSCGIWNLVAWPGIKPGSPAWGVQSLSHWTTREVPSLGFYQGCLIISLPSILCSQTPWKCFCHLPFTKGFMGWPWVPRGRSVLAAVPSPFLSPWHPASFCLAYSLLVHPDSTHTPTVASSELYFPSFTRRLSSYPS